MSVYVCMYERLRIYVSARMFFCVSVSAHVCMCVCRQLCVFMYVCFHVFLSCGICGICGVCLSCGIREVLCAYATLRM